MTTNTSEIKEIRSSEYISLEIECGTGSVELECFPHENEHGPVFFRYHGQYGSTTQGVKYHGETWDEFFARQHHSLKPIFQELVNSL